MSAPAAAWSWSPPTAARRPRWTSAVELFLVGEMGCQLALLAPGLDRGWLRIFWRTGVFAASLALLALLPGKTRRTPANVAALWVLAILAFELLHPATNSLAAGGAEVIMYLAILAPLFWMPRLRWDAHSFSRLLHLFWAYFTLSALTGLAQVYFPGRFEPRLSPVIASMGSAVEGLKITLANGHQIFRPMGLTDTPGGAADAGLWAVLFGLGFLLAARGHGRLLQRGLYFASMIAGMVVIYLSQTRVLLVVVAVWIVALMGLLVWHRHWRQFALLLLLAGVLGVGSLRVARGVGGAQMIARLATLGGGGHGHVFQKARGEFLRQTFTELIPQYPLGAGLGRWGMMNTYFGHNRDPRRGRIYVEIQWQGWVLDGGVPLLAAYLALLAATMISLGRLAARRGPMWSWAVLCLAYDIGVMALTFDYTPFTGESGLQFWFLNALVLAAVGMAARTRAPAPPPAHVHATGAL
ncbi:MAG: hypothetical protein ACRD01_04820 [Terriglobales bacterium]